MSAFSDCVISIVGMPQAHSLNDKILQDKLLIEQLSPPMNVCIINQPSVHSLRVIISQNLLTH